MPAGNLFELKGNSHVPSRKEGYKNVGNKRNNNRLWADHQGFWPNPTDLYESP